MNMYEVVYCATIRGVARVQANSDEEAEKKVLKGSHNGPAVEFLSESNITDITWDQALAIPARS